MQPPRSLQATYIRNALLHALRTTTKTSSHAAPTNFVYTNPSISALSAFVLRLLSGGALDSALERAARIGEMRTLLDKYSAELPAPNWKPATAGGEGETVLITGSTGRLGSHLLALLLQRGDVRRVYALNRGENGRGRQLEAFGTWKLDIGLLKDDKVVFYATDTTKKDLGLSKEVYEEVRSSRFPTLLILTLRIKQLPSSVTMIIHNGEHIQSARTDSRLMSFQHGASTSTSPCPPSSPSLQGPVTSSTSP